jgi:hypothetical protein
VADRKITLEELGKALHDAVTDRNRLCLTEQGAFYNVPDEPSTIELNMEVFSDRQERSPSAESTQPHSCATPARPLPSSNINPGVSNSSVEGTDPSSPITEPQLLASTPHLAAMPPGCATEPPDSVLTTGGAYPMLQSYASPFSVAQSTHGQRSACGVESGKTLVARSLLD